MHAYTWTGICMHVLTFVVGLSDGQDAFTGFLGEPLISWFKGGGATIACSWQRRHVWHKWGVSQSEERLVKARVVKLCPLQKPKTVYPPTFKQAAETPLTPNQSWRMVAPPWAWFYWRFLPLKGSSSFPLLPNVLRFLPQNDPDSGLRSPPFIENNYTQLQ